MKIKLRWKLTLIFCSTIMLCLFAGYIYLSAYLKKYAEQNLEYSIKHRILTGRDLVESKLTAQNLFSVADNIADKLGKQQELRVTIITRDGTVIGDSSLNAEEIERVENHLDRKEFQNADADVFGISKRYSYTIKRYLLYIAVPFANETVSGFIRYAVGLDDIERLESKLNKAIAAALLLVFILSFGFTFIISLIISMPLEEMATVARRMAKGDFSQKPSIYSKDEIGDLASTLSYMADQIKVKIELIKQEGAKLDAVLSSMFEGIMVVDENGQIILINPSLRKLFLVESPPESKSPIEAIRNPQVQDIVEKIIAAENQFISEEITLIQPQEKILKVNAVPIIRNEILEGAVLVFHDITELRRLEKVRQEFVANVSHELRTPITSIKGYSETILEGAIEDKDNLKEFINIIHHDSNRLASLIDDLLDLAKLESGKLNMVLLPLDIRPVLNRCLGILDKSISAKKLSVSVNIPPEFTKVMADDKRLTQVFLNLLDNAVKFSLDGGSINIKAFENGAFIETEISDTGIGIPETDLPRIFERFYRVDKARSRELGGTGLGLSIVKHIILAHGGQVSVKSVLGQGSTFGFTLPRA